ncbi:uncharacterized protein METZ01_LOCUS225923, partial [marine metagenome]
VLIFVVICSSFHPDIDILRKIPLRNVIQTEEMK